MEQVYTFYQLESSISLNAFIIRLRKRLTSGGSQRFVQTLPAVYGSRPHRTTLAYLTFCRSRAPERDTRRVGAENRTFDRWRTDRFLSRSTIIWLGPPCSQQQDVQHTQEDHQAQFYRGYSKVAEEYDKGFLKKHDEL